jgi:hypothetical protein
MFLGIALGRGMVGSIMAYAAYAANAQTPPFIADFVGGFYVANNQPTTLAGATTFARSGSATMFDSTGTLVTIADGAPRENSYLYEGGAWVNNGLQLESEARTNLVVQSEDFSNAAWSKQNVTTGAAVTSPDGSANAYPFVETTGTGEHNAFETVTGALTSGAPTTFSTFYKYVDRPFANLRTNLTGSWTNTFFNVQTGVIVSTGAGLTSAIEDCGSGWYRCSVTVLSASSTGEATVTVGMSADGTSAGYTGDGTSSILIYGAQVEAGSTPSSYIPTAGSTVTRAAETLTASAANLPWPTPVVIGPELVTDGGFSNGSTDWDVVSNNGWDFSGGSASHTGSTAGRIRQLVTTEVGKVYAVVFDLNTIGDFSISNTSIAVRNSADSVTTAIIGSSNFTPNADLSYSLYFVATGTSHYVAMYTVDNVALDNISVKEINPLAVSIQISGKMTAGGSFVNWQLNSDNFISIFLEASGAIPGRIAFRQQGLNVDGIVRSPNDTYPPGLNVPFNIASRHGSTFVNGAVNGTALTANTSQIALPDLENSNINIASGLMGHVHLVRVWAVDIGNTGIGVAST